MKHKKFPENNRIDPEWIIGTVNEIFNNDIQDLSDTHKKILREQYLKYLRDSYQPKEAMEKALQNVLCFKPK